MAYPSKHKQTDADVWPWALLLLIAVFAAYTPVWWAGYVWDDDYHLTGNPCIIGPLGLKEIWTTKAASICPLTLTSFWLEHKLWGLAPLPYHLVNVVLHGACAILLWRTLRVLEVPGAWLGAALWALHPLQVESVAWISELKNTQSGLFFLLAILFFLKGLRPIEAKDHSGVSWSYILALVFAALAMASKYSMLVLPGVLFLCAWWIEGRWRWRQLARVAPFLLMSFAAGILALETFGQNPAVTSDPRVVHTLAGHVVAAGAGIWFYLAKLVWPYQLIAIYPLWELDPGRSISYVPLLIAGISLLLLWRKSQARTRPYFFAFAYYLAAMLPELQLADSYVADHYQYLSSMGPLALAAAGMVRLAHLAGPKLRNLSLAGGALVLAGLGIVSWQRAWVYQSEETLWSDTLAKNPGSYAGYNNLGNVHLGNGELDRAIADFQQAVKIYPQYVTAIDNLGTAYLKNGQVELAAAQFQKALEIKPDFEAAHSNLGDCLMQTGQIDEAIAEYHKAQEINPIYEEACNNLGLALMKKGQLDQSIIEFQKALAINPNSDAAHYNLGNALYQKDQVDAAVAHYQRALEINPQYAEAFNNLGMALLRKGQFDEAATQFQKSLHINPNSPEAHNNLGLVLRQKGEVNDAVAQFQEALRLKPDYSEAQRNLAAAEPKPPQK